MLEMHMKILIYFEGDGYRTSRNMFIDEVRVTCEFLNTIEKMDLA